MRRTRSGFPPRPASTSPRCWKRSCTRLPPPKGDRDAPLKALLVDSWYDLYLGVVVLVRIVDGVLRKDQRIRMMRTDAAYNVDRVGVFTPKLTPAEELGPGEIGFLTGSIKEVADTRVGDTITDDRKPAAEPPARLPSRRSRWCSAACSRSTPRSSRTCAQRWGSCASTTRASPSRWKPAPRSASASAAASSGSCTSRSSRSGWSASSTST